MQKKLANLIVKDLVLANIGDRYYDAALSDFNESDYKDTLRKYISNIEDAYKHGYGLYIQGDNSCGKTHGLVVVLKAALHYSYSALFLTTHELKQVAFSSGDFTKSDVMSVDFLGIDDFGKEQYTEPGQKKNIFFESFLEEVLRQRVYQKLPTLYTANMAVKDIPTYYNRSIANLMASVSKSVPVVGKNFRATEQILVKDWFNSL